MTLKNHRHNHDIDIYDDVEKIKKVLMEATQDVKVKAADIFSDSVESVRDQTISAKDSVQNYTTKKPFKSLGIAVAIGFAIGFLLKK